MRVRVSPGARPHSIMASALSLYLRDSRSTRDGGSERGDMKKMLNAHGAVYYKDFLGRKRKRCAGFHKCRRYIRLYGPNFCRGCR